MVPVITVVILVMVGVSDGVAVMDTQMDHLIHKHRVIPLPNLSLTVLELVALMERQEELQIPKEHPRQLH